MGPKEIRDAILFLVRGIAKIKKNPAWVFKKGTFGSPVVEQERSVASWVNINIFTTQGGLYKYLHIYTCEPGICTFVHNNNTG